MIGEITLDAVTVQLTILFISLSGSKFECHFYIVLPHIKKPSSRRRRPGDCKDVTNEKIIHEHVGINLCYHTSSILYLHCVTDRGNPKPRITWRKDGSNLPKAVKLLNNGTTLLFQNTKIDLQAEVDGLPTVGGNYTCMAANPSGTVTASSVIIPIGGKPNHF